MRYRIPIPSRFTPHVIRFQRESSTSSILNPKRSRINSSLNDAYIGMERGSTPGVVLYFWSDTVRPAYAIWGNAIVNTTKSFTPATHVYTLSYTHIYLDLSEPKKPPICLTPYPWIHSKGAVTTPCRLL